MEKHIAIVTGASGGIGKEFTKLMTVENVEEVWTVARNKQNLDKLKEKLGTKVRVFSKDLTKVSDIKALEEVLAKEKPVISYLINNAGMLKMGKTEELSVEDAANMVDLNSRSMVLMCKICLPFMQSGSRIINIASASAFLPLPYINIYAASKAFARNYSRALGYELKNTGITVTTVCPGWVDTALVPQTYHGKKTNFFGVVTPEPVARKAVLDAKKGKAMSVYSLTYKAMHALTKVVPQSAAMRVWDMTMRK